jgi:hypothetical protein
MTPAKLDIRQTSLGSLHKGTNFLERICLWEGIRIETDRLNHDMQVERVAESAIVNERHLVRICGCSADGAATERFLETGNAAEKVLG